MIQVTFAEPADAGWQDWKSRCREATEAILQSQAKKPATEINADLYKEQRLIFLRAFNGKCAYCELKIIPGQRAGDVEHYRPKGRVMDEHGKPVFSKIKRHLGYYWLAYQWDNLLPSCLACNRPGTDPKGLASGKWDRFPVGNGFWAEGGAATENEKPLLLNPWKDNPRDHLIFDQTGIIGHKSERGRATWEILGLNRDGLPEARREAYQKAQWNFRKLHEAIARADSKETAEAERELDDVWYGIAQFSAAARAGLDEAKRQHDERRRNSKYT